MRLLISSFDATIPVKRAFHPAPASRGFASHVFLVSTVHVRVDNMPLKVVTDSSSVAPVAIKDLHQP